MKNILNRLIQHEILTKEEAKDVLVNISSGSYNPSQIAAFMTVYMMRSITIEELAHWFLKNILDNNQQFTQHAIQAVEIKVYNGPGQSAGARWEQSA